MRYYMLEDFIKYALYMIIGTIIFVLITVYYFYQKSHWTSFEIWWKKRQAKKLYDILNKIERDQNLRS